jgi:hypothetical protein
VYLSEPGRWLEKPSVHVLGHPQLEHVDAKNVRDKLLNLAHATELVLLAA